MFNDIRAGRTQVRIAERLAELADRDIPFRPYTDDEMQAMKDEIRGKVAPIIKENRLVCACVALRCVACARARVYVWYHVF